MTVSESIIIWLKTFSQEKQYLKMGTDILRPGTEMYSLAKEPVQNIKTYLSGKKEYTDHYMFRACLPSINNVECINNNVFGETLTEWVNEQNRKKVYPVIENAAVTEISITTPYYLGVTKENDSIYQMTIAIKYVKES